MTCRPAVGAVVVTHRADVSAVRRCLDALVDAGGLAAIVLVDNGPGPAMPVDERTDTSPWQTVRTSNDGFGAAVNRGVEHLRQLNGFDDHLDDDVLIAVLNDDVVVDSEWLPPLVDAILSDTRIGAVQPKLLLADTEPVQVNSVGVHLDRSGAGTDVGFGEPDGPSWTGRRAIEIFTGGAVLFSAGFLDDLGGFDERYFLYYEDVDLALRGRERGWAYLCEPAGMVRHTPGSSTDALGHHRRYLQERNRLWIAARFASPSGVARAWWLSLRRLRHTPRRAHLRALAGGSAGAPRALVERFRTRRRERRRGWKRDGSSG